MLYLLWCLVVCCLMYYIFKYEDPAKSTKKAAVARTHVSRAILEATKKAWFERYSKNRSYK